MIRLLKVLWRYHNRRVSLTRQGLVPWWVERAGVSPTAKTYASNTFEKERRAR